MDHDVGIDGLGCRLRPARADDSAFIISLRMDPELSRYLNPISGRIEDQLAWFDSYRSRSNDWYWIIENLDGSPEGTISIYDRDPETGLAEWGRWILRPGSLAAVESVWLCYRVAFEILGLNGLYCRTVVANAQVASFHDSCGLNREQLLYGVFEIHGTRMDMVKHSLPKLAWHNVDVSLQAKVQRLAGMRSRSRG